MMEKMKRYNNARDSQPRSTAPQQPPQRPNPSTIQSDSLETKNESTHLWQLAYSYTNQSNKASAPSSTLSRKRKFEASRLDPDTKRNLENIMQDLQELKRVRRDQDPDQDTHSNPLSLRI